MVIIQKLIQALGILPGHGIGTDGTLLQGPLQSGLFFINSFCSCNGNPQIKDQEQHGKDNQITFQLAGTKARALLDVTEPVRVGDTVSLTLDPRFVYFFDEATGTRLYGEAGQ